LYYYVRIFRNIFLREAEGSKEPIQFSVWQIAIVLLLVVPTLVFGLYFTPIVNAAIASVKMFGLR
jgi:NADH-quinone oxidoreductase subunit N